MGLVLLSQPVRQRQDFALAFAAMRQNRSGPAISESYHGLG
jgi:hypothetical protein